MDLSKILSISGKPGLYKLIGESKSSLVVESMIDGKRGPAFSHERISTLKEISIYTDTGDVPLEDVFRKIYEMQDGKPVMDTKKATSDQIKELFEKVLPDYDREAVYVSDMKKVFTWYNFLLEKDVLVFTEEEAGKEEEENTETKEDKTGDEGQEEKPEDQADEKA